MNNALFFTFKRKFHQHLESGTVNNKHTPLFICHPIRMINYSTASFFFSFLRRIKIAAIASSLFLGLIHIQVGTFFSLIKCYIYIDQLHYEKDFQVFCSSFFFFCWRGSCSLLWLVQGNSNLGTTEFSPFIFF